MDMRLHLFRHVQSLSFQFLQEDANGRYHVPPEQRRVAEIQKVATDSALNFALSFLTLVGTAGLLAWLNWRLSYVLVLHPVQRGRPEALPGSRSPGRQKRFGSEMPILPPFYWSLSGASNLSGPWGRRRRKPPN